MVRARGKVKIATNSSREGEDCYQLSNYATTQLTPIGQFHPRPIPRPPHCPRMVASKKGMGTSAWWNRRQSWQFRRRERCRLVGVPPRRMCRSQKKPSLNSKYIFESIESNRFVICPPWRAVNAAVSKQARAFAVSGIGATAAVCVLLFCSRLMTSLPYVRTLCQLRRLSVTPQQLGLSISTFNLTNDGFVDRRRAIEQESPVIAPVSRYCHFTLFSACHFLLGYRGMP